MKMIREEVEAIVKFTHSSTSPVIVTCSQGKLKIDRIIKSWKERRNLKDCLIFLCHIDGKCNPVELRWELESNRWFLEKI